MKRMMCLLLLVVLLTACGAGPVETEQEMESCGAPLAPVNEVSAEELEETVQVEFVCDGGMIVVQLPIDWQWEVDEITEDAFAMGISFRPGTETEGWLRLQYCNGGFGVCGTGLEEKEVAFDNGLVGRAGFYDGNEAWSFISFYPDYKEYALTVDFADWVMDYEQQIFDILGTAQLG